ncbi:polyprotein [Euscelidius variegatus virus 1]|uniref:polyprotein n=1 Tax=Euscelidius variegatus virus 1 TaxID=1920698 RepID=UPI00090C7043|nr:polyprotein [Euscelidius variegatus virus 1]APD68841.1 polyprotein [Euscelidius variegatus virus 1]
MASRGNILFGSFSHRELAEFDFAKSWRGSKPKSCRVEVIGSRFSYVWEKLKVRKERRTMQRPSRPKLTAREKLRYGLKKKFAGQPAAFYYAFERFLGGGRMKSVASFYKEIYDELRAEAVKACRRTRKNVPTKIRHLSNRYVLLEEEAGLGDYIPTPEDLDDSAPCIMRPRRAAEDRSNLLVGPRMEPTPPPKRDIRLRILLRARIALLAARRCTPAQAEERVAAAEAAVKVLQRVFGRPEMEDQQGDELVHNKSGNVILSESNPAGATITAKPAIDLKWSKACSSEIATDYTYLTNRWTLIKHGTWDNTTNVNAELTDFKLKLPFDIRHTGAAGAVPMRAPFDVFAYYRSDIEIKIHVNSNKFQMGQLQFSFQYMDHYRANDSFNNIYSRSQLPNVVVNAGASNEVTLYIPYKNVCPMMSTKWGCIGTLRCFVIRPLNSGDNCPKSCGITIYARLPNCEFVGMRDGGVEPEMEAAAAAMVAGAVYDKVIGDKNCDEPVAAENPSYVVPTASHTWSLSSGLTSKLHNLRLMGPTKQVARPVGIDSSETSIGVPCRTFGMLKHIPWDATNADTNKNGYELWRCDAHPQIDKSKFYKLVVSNALDTYAVPPVGVVAGLYKQWRGSLEFKFDIVCTQYHTGRLLVAYIPGVDASSDKITLERARNSPCAEFSLQDSSSFTFTVPYISYVPWFPRKYGGPLDAFEIEAPSCIVVFVLNPLVYMESVPKKVWLVPYVRGGIDFEVSVPIQPSNSLGCNNKSTIKDQDKVYPDNKSIPFRVTKSQKFYDSTKYVCYEGTDTLGTVAGWHPSSTPMKKQGNKVVQCYYAKADTPGKLPAVKWNIYNGETKKYEDKLLFVGYIVLWYSTDDNYWYGVPFPEAPQGESYAKMVAAGLLLGKDRDKIKTYCFNFIEDSNWSSSQLAELKFTPVLMELAECERLWQNIKEPFVFVERGLPEMEERFSTLNLLNPVPNLVSTGCGEFTYNENFSDLKDLCRRYQLYLNKDIVLDASFNNGEGIAVVPIIPSGLPLDVEDPESIWNYIRDGHIPMVSNGYVFFRGSIRMRIILSSDDDCFDGSSIWVQHHPDMSNDDPLTPQYFSKLNTDDKLKCHGYGFYIQNLHINRIVEIEVPFYQGGMYGLLNNVTAANEKKIIHQYLTLGNLVIGLCTPCIKSTKTVNLQIYYSIGDDMSFSTFRGFDMVCFTDEVWKPDRVNLPEMEEAHPEMWNAVCTGVVSSLASLGAGLVARGATTALATNIKKDIGTAIGEAIAARLSEPINDVAAEVKQARQELVQQTVDGLKDSVLTNVLCQLAHIAVAPTLATVAVSFGSVLVQILNLSVNQLTIYADVCKKFFSGTWGHFSKIVLPDAPTAGMPESDFDLDECERSLLALIFTSICTLFGCSGYIAPKGCGSLLSGINSGVCLFNNFIRLLENCGKVIKKFIKYINSKLNPGVHLEGLLEDDCPEVERWVAEVQFLLDARNKERFVYDRLMLARVFDATTFGALLVSNGLDERKPGGKVLWDLFKEIRKLRNDLCERGAHPDVRFETFPIWITGDPGIGKSYMVKELSNRLLRSINHRQPGSMIYDIQPGAKYWSGVTNPAVLVSDDMFQVGGTRMEEELANVFMICSSSVLNPPMAAVEDKERRLNPLLYLMLANSSFPDLGTVCRTPRALYRRRKFLIEAKYTEDILERYPNILDSSDLPRHETQNFAHLRFSIARDPKDVDTDWGAWMSYDEMMVIVEARFRRHYEHERANFRERMINMYNLDPNFNEMNLIDEIPALQNIASLREQMEIVRARVARQIDELNDPGREPDQDVWHYIRRFRDYVAGLHNAPEMAPPNGYAVSEPPHVDFDTFSIASEGGYRHRMTDFNGVFDFRQALREHLDKMRPNHQEEMSPYMARYLDHFSDLHEAFVKQMEHLPTNCKDKFKEMYAKYPNSEIMGVDLLLNAETRQRVEYWYAIGFVARFAAAGDGSTAHILQTFSDFNLTIYEMLQFLMYETGRAGDVAKFLICAEEPQNFCDMTGSGVFNEGWDLVDCTEVAGRRVPLLEKNENMFIDTGAKELASFVQNNFRPLNYFSKVGDGICRRFPEIPEAIKESFKNSSSYEQLYSACKMLMVLPESMNGLYVDGMYAGYCAMSIVLTLQCLYNWHNCETRISYLHPPSYCHIRNNLVAADGVRITTCPQVGCKFNNEFYYLLGCHYAQSHAFIQSYRQVGPEDYEDTQLHFSLHADTLMKLRRERKTTKGLNSFKHYIKDFFLHTLPTRLWQIFLFCMEWLPLIITAIMVVYRMYQFFAGIDDQDEQPSADPEANYFKFNQPKFPQKPKVPTSEKVFNPPEMSTEQRQVMINRINKNGVLIYVNWVQDGTRMNRNCRCLMLGGRNMLVLRHYLEEYSALVEQGFKLNVDLVFGNKIGDPVKVNITFTELMSQVAYCDNSNFCIVVLPKFVRQFPKIYPYFATRANHDNVSGKVDMITVAGESSFDLPVSVSKNFVVSETANSSEVVCERVYGYAKRSPGLCGSVIISNSLGSGNGAIIGMHIAGNAASGTGYAEPLYQEMFAHFFQAMPTREVLEPAVIDISHADVELDGNMFMYGCVPPAFAHKESGRTNIVPSLLYGQVYQPVTEVNPLRPNDPRQPPGSHPLRDGCNKHGSGNVLNFDPKFVNMAKEDISDRLNQIVTPIRAEIKPLTLQQAICGDVDVPHFESLNWKSSEGFPLSAQRPKNAHDKKWLFDLTEGEFGYELKDLHVLLKQQLKLRDECFKKDIKPPTVYVDCLKDYRLKPEKCAKPGSTRIFSVAPIQCSIDVRQHLTDFTASLKQSHIVNSIGIGINPDSLEWTALVNYLFEVGPCIVTLDYSNFGPCLMSQLVAASNECIVQWHKSNGASEEHVNRVEWLLDCDILNPVHLCSNVLYQTVNGIASGSPLTGECNSIPNLFYIRCAYLEIMTRQNPEFANMYYFNLFVRIVVYGDDLIMSISPDIIDYFNAIEIKNALALHGIVVTSAQKDDELKPFDTIYNSTFLKRSFKEHPTRKGVWLAPVEVNSVQECVNWMHRCDDGAAATLEVVQASLDLAYGHGPQYYNEHRARLVSACKSLNIFVHTKTWYERDNEIFGETVEEVKSFNARLPWYYRLDSVQLTIEADSSKLSK